MFVLKDIRLVERYWDWFKINRFQSLDWRGISSHKLFLYLATSLVACKRISLFNYLKRKTQFSHLLFDLIKTLISLVYSNIKRMYFFSKVLIPQADTTQSILNRSWTDFLYNNILNRTLICYKHDICITIVKESI